MSSGIIKNTDKPPTLRGPLLLLRRRFQKFLGQRNRTVLKILRVAYGPRVKLISCKSALNPPVVYSTDRSKAVVPVLVLLFVALWFILRGDLVLCLTLCYFVLVCFQSFLALQLPRLGKRELILVLFVRLFSCACLVLSVSSSSWCLGRAAVCDCSTPWTFLLPFFIA